MPHRKIKTWLAVLSTTLLFSSTSFAQTGSISSDFSKCFIPPVPGVTTCPVNISWTSSGASNVCVWRIHNTLAPSKWKCAATGQNEAFNTLDTTGRVFELRRNSSGSYASSILMDSVPAIASTDYSTELGNGSSYAWYEVDSSDCSNSTPASRINHVVLRRYHIPTERSKIQFQIDQMIESGQDMIRIPVYHAHCGAVPAGDAYSGATCSAPSRHNSSSSASDSGQLPETVKQNLKDLINYAFSKGVKTVLIGFFPGHENRVIDWHQVNADLLEENWSVIKSTKDYLDLNILPPAGKRIIWELGNEMVPASSLDQNNVNARLNYMGTIWARWINFFSPLESIGFSVYASTTGHLEQRLPYIPSIYGLDINPGAPRPLAVDVHLYGCPNENSSDARCREDVMYLTARDLLDQSGLSSLPLAIGESFYHDDTASINIRKGIAAVNDLPLYAIQWVRKRGAGAHCFEAPPDETSFNVF